MPDQPETQTLWLARHAKTSPAQPGQTDFDRQLTDYGHQQTRQIRNWLDQQVQWSRCRILCSPAARTHQTMLGSTPEHSHAECELERSIYAASAGELQEVINAHISDTSQLVLFGHNPAVSQIAQWLAGYEQMYQGLRPGDVAGFEGTGEINPDQWSLTVLLRHK